MKKIMQNWLVKWQHTVYNNHTIAGLVHVLYLYWTNDNQTHTNWIFQSHNFSKNKSVVPHKHWIPCNKRATCGGMWCDVMAASFRAAAGSGCVCAGMWRAKGLMGWGWVQRESGKGTGWGKGGERPKWKRVPNSLHTALCQMLTSNYLESHHIVLAGKEKD